MSKLFVASLVGVGLILSPVQAAIPCGAAAKDNYECGVLSWSKKAEVKVTQYQELEDLINYLLDGDEAAIKCQEKLNTKYGPSFEEDFPTICFNDYWKLVIANLKNNPNRGVQLGSLGVIFYTFMDTPPPESNLKDILNTAKKLLVESKDSTIIAFVLRGLKYYPADTKDMLDLYVKLMSHDEMLVRQMAYAELSYQTDMKLPFDADKPQEVRGGQIEAINQWLQKYKPGKA